MDVLPGFSALFFLDSLGMEGAMFTVDTKKKRGEGEQKKVENKGISQGREKNVREIRKTISRIQFQFHPLKLHLSFKT